jgi:hypothetical protein
MLTTIHQGRALSHTCHRDSTCPNNALPPSTFHGPDMSSAIYYGKSANSHDKCMKKMLSFWSLHGWQNQGTEDLDNLPQEVTEQGFSWGRPVPHLERNNNNNHKWSLWWNAEWEDSMASNLYMQPCFPIPSGPNLWDPVICKLVSRFLSWTTVPFNLSCQYLRREPQRPKEWSVSGQLALPGPCPGGQMRMLEFPPAEHFADTQNLCGWLWKHGHFPLCAGRLSTHALTPSSPRHLPL